MSTLRVIGDVHNLQQRYLNVVQGCAYSVQLGDFSYTYDVLMQSGLNPEHHKIIQGNHDNYDAWTKDVPYLLGDFGYYNLGNISFFFVRGGYSLDQEYRQKYYLTHGVKSWWEEEELSYKSGLRALELYCHVKPDLVLSHDCPETISSVIGNVEVLQMFGLRDNFTSPTQILLELMRQKHKPKLWVFGHYHKSVDMIVDCTRFICLNELEAIDIDEYYNVREV